MISWDCPASISPAVGITDKDGGRPSVDTRNPPQAVPLLLRVSVCDNDWWWPETHPYLMINGVTTIFGDGTSLKKIFFQCHFSLPPSPPSLSWGVKKVYENHEIIYDFSDLIVILNQMFLWFYWLKKGQVMWFSDYYGDFSAFLQWFGGDFLIIKSVQDFFRVGPLAILYH